ncbi:MAG: hypothetical protein KKA90_02890 [Nanoarchaeota archaeon]|nr:hypothetical protein [Nanoarchaeota archaeon]
MSGSRAVFFLAVRDLKRDRKIFGLVIFLLIFSYINLTFFPAFLNGLSNTFQDEIVDTGTSHILLQPASGREYLDSVKNIQQKIELIPGVVATSTHIGGSASLAVDGATAGKKPGPATPVTSGLSLGAQVMGLTPSEDQYVTPISQRIVSGDWLSDDDTDKVVLGLYIAGERLEDKIGETTLFGTLMEGLGGVQPGDVVQATFTNGVVKNYKVKGIVHSEGFSFVSQTAYFTTKELEDVYGLHDQASSILVRLNDPENADKVKTFIIGLGIKQADILTWKEASNFAEGLSQTFGIVNVVTNIVGIVIVLATVSIVIFINTARKKRIIGVLKAIGLRESLVLRVFLVESLIFGVIGSLGGMAIMGILLSFFKASPIVLPIGLLTPVVGPDIFFGSAFIIIFISLFGGYFPSRLASRADIIDSLKVVE